MFTAVISSWAVTTLDKYPAAASEVEIIGRYESGSDPMTIATSSISDQTAISWLKKLGYTYKDVKKGPCHNSHK
jgi:hypothetical protein